MNTENLISGYATQSIFALLYSVHGYWVIRDDQRLHGSDNRFWLMDRNFSFNIRQADPHIEYNNTPPQSWLFWNEVMNA